MCPESRRTPAPWNTGTSSLSPPSFGPSDTQSVTDRCCRGHNTERHQVREQSQSYWGACRGVALRKGRACRGVACLALREGRARRVLSPTSLSERGSSCLKSLSEYPSAGHESTKAKASRVGSHHLGRCFYCREIHLPSQATLKFGCPLLVCPLPPKTDPFSFHITWPISSHPHLLLFFPRFFTKSQTHALSLLLPLPLPLSLSSSPLSLLSLTSRFCIWEKPHSISETGLFILT